MKIKVLFSLALNFFFFQIIISQSIAGLYQTGKVPSGTIGFVRASLQLNKDSTFQFHYLNDQSDYSATYTAYGIYKIKTGKLKLLLDEEIKPKVKVDTTQGKYITFYAPLFSGLYIKLFDSEGKRIPHLTPNNREKKYLFTPPYCSARILCTRNYSIDLLIDQPSNIYISNLQPGIAYFIDAFSFRIKKKKLKGQLISNFGSKKTKKWKLVFYKKKLRFSILGGQ